MFNEKTWKDGEKKTQQFLKKNGYKILYTNFSCVGVELDIVSLFSKRNQLKLLKKEQQEKLLNCKSNEEKEVINVTYKNITKHITPLLVVTEVKSRSSEKFGKGFESISETKKNHIKRGAEFLLKNSKFEGLQVRFDVASVDDGVLSYIENAF